VSDTGEIRMRPIGTVRSPVRDAVDADWGPVVSRIQLLPELAAGLRGLKGFSHAVVVFRMHEATFDAQKHLVRRPREREDMPELGIFSQRARHRPNAIGVSVVAIEGVESDTLVVRGLDAIDGTPVLDIKPHVRAFDAPPGSAEPEWIGRLMAGYF
jgi:tRNA (adenine37-N6)-methyltransferase